MLDMGSDNRNNNASTYFGFGKRNFSDESKKVSMLPLSSIRPRIPFRSRKNGEKKDGKDGDRRRSTDINGHAADGSVARPPQAVTPISRSDTTSAASTVYAVRYQNVSSPSPAIPEEMDPGLRSRRPSVHINGQTIVYEEAESTTLTNNTKNEPASMQAGDERDPRDISSNRQMWQAVANPFKRKRAEPPAEVAAQMAASNVRRSPAQTYHNLRDRFSHFTSSQKDRLGGKKRTGPSPPMPVTVIPAQPRPSRLQVPSETPRTGSLRPSERLSAVRDSRSSSSRSSAKRKESMPVTVIPAPTRGGRTWSPDDLPPDSSSANSQRLSIEGGKALNIEGGGMTPQPANGHNDDVHVMRGALTIAESPMRARDHDSRSRNSLNNNRSSARLRTPTIDSLNDRLSSTSPGSRAISSNGTSSEAAQRPSPGSAGSPQTPVNQGGDQRTSDQRSSDPPDSIPRPDG